jgi:hypothetical protein
MLSGEIGGDTYSGFFPDDGEDDGESFQQQKLVIDQRRAMELQLGRRSSSKAPLKVSLSAAPFAWARHPSTSSPSRPIQSDDQSTCQSASGHRAVS